MILGKVLILIRIDSTSLIAYSFSKSFYYNSNELWLDHCSICIHIKSRKFVFNLHGYQFSTESIFLLSCNLGQTFRLENRNILTSKLLLSRLYFSFLMDQVLMKICMFFLVGSPSIQGAIGNSISRKYENLHVFLSWLTFHTGCHR